MGEDKGIELINAMFDESTPPDPEAMAFVQTLMEESDRGCVLVGTAFLSRELETLLRDALKCSEAMVKTAVDPLFKGGNAPIGSLWAKIKLASAMGLITAKTHDALDKMRELRNAFAHTAAPVSLSDERVRPILSTLEAHVQHVVKTVRLFVQAQLSETNSAAKQHGSALPDKPLLSIQKLEFAFAVASCETEILQSGRKVLAAKKST